MNKLSDKELAVIDGKLKVKLQDLKEQARHDELVGLIVNIGENLIDELKQAVGSIEINVPEIVIPKIDTPIIPEIKIPEIVMPDFPTITIPEIKLPNIEVPKAEVTVTIPDIKLPTINVPQPKVTVNVPEIKFPNTPTQLPQYNGGSVEYKLEPPTEIWHLTMNGELVANVTLVYFDTDRMELKSFDIEKL